MIFNENPKKRKRLSMAKVPGGAMKRMWRDSGYLGLVFDGDDDFVEGELVFDTGEVIGAHFAF